MVQFELEDEVLKGYVVVDGEKIPFRGRRISCFVGEGVTVEMLEAFRYGRRLGRGESVNIIAKELKKIVEVI